jgi:hypothetical protein
MTLHEEVYIRDRAYSYRLRGLPFIMYNGERGMVMYTVIPQQACTSEWQGAGGTCPSDWQGAECDFTNRALWAMGYPAQQATTCWLWQKVVTMVPAGILLIVEIRARA